MEQENKSTKKCRASHKAYMVVAFLSLTLILSLVIVGNFVYSAYADVVSVRNALDNKVTELTKCNNQLTKEIDSSQIILRSEAVDMTDVATKLLHEISSKAEQMLVDIPTSPTNINQRWQIVSSLSCDSETASTLASLKNAQLQVLENMRNQQVAKATAESGAKVLAGAEQQARQLEQLVELEVLRQQFEREAEVAQALRQPQCPKSQFENSEGVQFMGCANPLFGDEHEYDWKLWEEALDNGDLCLATDVVSGKQYALPRNEC